MLDLFDNLNEEEEDLFVPDIHLEEGEVVEPIYDPEEIVYPVPEAFPDQESNPEPEFEEEGNE